MFLRRSSVPFQFGVGKLCLLQSYFYFLHLDVTSMTFLFLSGDRPGEIIESL